MFGTEPSVTQEPDANTALEACGCGRGGKNNRASGCKTRQRSEAGVKLTAKRGVGIIPQSANKWKRMHQTKGKRAIRCEEAEGNMKGQEKGQKCVKQDKTQEKRKSCKIKQEAAQADVEEAFCC